MIFAKVAFAVFAIVSTAGAFLVGVTLAGSISQPALWDMYDRVFPVSDLDVVVLSRTSDSVTLNLKGERFRGECEPRGVFAYAKQGQVLRDINIVRIDKPSEIKTRPPGKYNFGVWMAWPLDSVGAFVIYVKYDCSGRTVFVNANEVKI